MTLPNFLIIGATKAGTTSLHHYLGQHPDVFVCKQKETNYFAPESALCFLGKRVEQEDSYKALFNDVEHETAIGETSPAYLAVPWTPEKIKNYIPKMKLIAILRNPIDRAYSHYLMRIRQGREDRTFKECIAQDDLDPEHSYKSRGFYGEQLERYLEHFLRDQIKIFLYEELNQNPNAVLHDCFKFLNVDPTFTADMTQKYNANPDAEPISDDVRNSLIELYKEDVLKLQKHIQQDVSTWLKM